MTRLAAALVGVVFGFTLAWSGLANPDVIRAGLLFQEAHLFLLFFAAMATAFAGVTLLRRSGARALITREPIAAPTLRPERRHVFGSVLFGLGWAVSAACPGPIAAQAGQGMVWSFVTLAGLVLGLKLHALRARRREPAPAPAPART